MKELEAKEFDDVYGIWQMPNTESRLYFKMTWIGEFYVCKPVIKLQGITEEVNGNIMTERLYLQNKAGSEVKSCPNKYAKSKTTIKL